MSERCTFMAEGKLRKVWRDGLASAGLGGEPRLPPPSGLYFTGGGETRFLPMATMEGPTNDDLPGIDPATLVGYWDRAERSWPNRT